jgi:uncharacterized protein with von Willebrand factor type A (vWA) domain
VPSSFDTAPTAGRLLPAVDRAAFVVPFGCRLRAAGVGVSLSSLGAFTDALAAAPPRDRRSLYWVARVTLVRRHSELTAFDEVFDAVFADAELALDRSATAPASSPSDENRRAPDGREASAQHADGGLPWHTLPRLTEAAADTPDGSTLPDLLPSAVERIADIPFDALDERQLALLGGWLQQAARQWPMRQSRRQQLHPRGRRVAMRETLVRSRRTGWEPILLSRRRPVQRPRPIVMLTDVSQSMQGYSTAYLHLMRAFVRSGRAETFAFSTSLTRLTPALAHRSAKVAMAQATDRVVDRYSGTHLASSLRELLTSRHGSAVRGGVLVIASDGWDSDEPDRLAAAMARARLRAHRVIWLNPRAASPGFAPLVGSMAAALPYCHDFLPAHTTRALADVLEVISGARLLGADSSARG